MKSPNNRIKFPYQNKLNSNLVFCKIIIDVLPYSKRKIKLCAAFSSSINSRHLKMTIKTDVFIWPDLKSFFSAQIFSLSCSISIIYFIINFNCRMHVILVTYRILLVCVWMWAIHTYFMGIKNIFSYLIKCKFDVTLILWTYAHIFKKITHIACEYWKCRLISINITNGSFLTWIWQFNLDVLLWWRWK